MKYVHPAKRPSAPCSVFVKDPTHPPPFSSDGQGCCRASKTYNIKIMSNFGNTSLDKKVKGDGDFKINKRRKAEERVLAVLGMGK